MENNGFEKSETISGSFFMGFVPVPKFPPLQTPLPAKNIKGQSFIGHLTKDIFDI